MFWMRLLCAVYLFAGLALSSAQAATINLSYSGTVDLTGIGHLGGHLTQFPHDRESMRACRAPITRTEH